MSPTIVKQTGLSGAQLRAYVKKLYKFFGGLTKPEQKVFLASMGTEEDAMASFHPSLTPAKLDAFLKSCKPPDDVVIIIEGADGDDDGD